MKEILPHILVVDDDLRIRSLLKAYLAQNKFYVSSAKDSITAKILLKKFRFNLLILDVMMPGEDGISLTNFIRKTSDVPIVMLTAKGEVNDKIEGLEAKVDDYLVKPFEPKELLLRINRILSRIKNDSEIIKFGDFEFDSVKKTLLKNGNEVILTQTEADLLHMLAQNKGTVSREDLASQCGGINPRTVDVQVIRLRSKIESNPKFPKHLKTIRGKGYCLL